MAKMTSAYANKVLKKLAEDKEFWRKKELQSYTYVAATDEEPVIPDYDYAAVAAEISAIDEKIVKIKHAINVNNVTNRIPVGGIEMSVDEILVKWRSSTVVRWCWMKCERSSRKPDCSPVCIL